MCSVHRIALALAILPASHLIVLGQGKRTSQGEWSFHVGGGLLWNTVHGDRYVAPPALRGFQLRDLDFLKWRSSARNSFSPAGGFTVNRQILKTFSVLVGLDFVDRKEYYTFDEDTLLAYPPVLSPPDGLHIRGIIDHEYQVGIPLFVEYRYSSWSCMGGLTLAQSIH